MEETKTLENKVFEALGAVSICWKPLPSGEFDGTAAKNVGEELMLEIKSDVSNAIDVISRALIADEDFFYAMQANIAMAFKDEFSRHPKKYKSKKDVDEIANDAAIRFLQILSGKKSL